MKRSKSIKAVCIVFGILGLAGIGDSIVMFFGAIEVVPAWLGFFTLLFGISAGVTAVGVWRMKRWGLVALRFWFASCLMLFVAAANVFYSTIPGGIALVVTVAVLITGIYLALDRFVSSRLSDAA